MVMKKTCQILSLHESFILEDWLGFYPFITFAFLLPLFWYHLDMPITGYSLSEELNHVSINPKYDNRLFVELPVQYKKTTSSVQAFLDFLGFDFRNFRFTAVYNSILFSSPLVLLSKDWPVKKSANFFSIFCYKKVQKMILFFYVHITLYCGSWNHQKFLTI